MDIMSMLKSAQSDYNSRHMEGSANNSVSAFFNQCAAAPSQPIPIQIQQNMTLESIEKNLPAKISPPNLDTHLSNNNNNDLANSPLAKFLNSSTFNAPKQVIQDNGSNSVILVSGNKGLVPPGFNTSQPMAATNGTKETKLITPAMLTSNAINNNHSTAASNGTMEKKIQPEPLNKNQLVQALKFLIDNDEDFTKKVHEAYLKSMNGSMNS